MMEIAPNGCYILALGITESDLMVMMMMMMAVSMLLADLSGAACVHRTTELNEVQIVLYASDLKSKRDFRRDNEISACYRKVNKKTMQPTWQTPPNRVLHTT